MINLGFSSPLADRLPLSDAFGLHCQSDVTVQSSGFRLLDLKININSVSLTNAFQTLRIELPANAIDVVSERLDDQCVISYEPFQYYNNAYLTDTKGYPVNTFYVPVKNSPPLSHRATGPLNSLEGCSRALENTEDSARYCEYTVVLADELLFYQPNSTMPTTSACRQLIVYGNYENGFLTGAYPEDIPDNQVVTMASLRPDLPVIRVHINRNNKNLPAVYDYASSSEFFGFFNRANNGNNPAGCSADGVKFAAKVHITSGDARKSNAVLCYRERGGEREWGYAWKTVHNEQKDMEQRENPLEQRFCYSFSLPESGIGSRIVMVAPTYFIPDGFVAISSGTLMESDSSTLVDVFYENELVDEPTGEPENSGASGTVSGKFFSGFYITIGTSAVAAADVISVIIYRAVIQHPNHP